MTISLAKEANTVDPDDGKHRLVCLDASGDTKITWDPDNADEVANARRTFDDLRKKGMQAFAVGSGGRKADVITSFDATAEKLIMAPALRGG